MFATPLEPGCALTSLAGASFMLGATSNSGLICSNGWSFNDETLGAPDEHGPAGHGVDHPIAPELRQNLIAPGFKTHLADLERIMRLRQPPAL